MPSEPRSRRLAVLIDADNVPARIADGLFEAIAKIGDASVRRIYSDFSNGRSTGWADALSKHAIIPQQQSANVPGKNASDTALVIDAMDLLHSRRLDGFCLVSSDSDFTRLATRIREDGVDVFGFGALKTPMSFRQACRRFVYTEELSADASENGINPASPPKSRRPPSAAIPKIRAALAQIKSKDGWANLSEVGNLLPDLASDFGYRKLSDLVDKTGAFDIDRPDSGASCIRAKSVPAKPSRSKVAV